MGYCEDSGYQKFCPDALQRYAIDENWIADAIRSSIGLPLLTAADRAAVRTPIRVGDARFGPYRCVLFFGRRLFEHERFDEACIEIERLAGGAPTILLTTTARDLVPGLPPRRCAIIQMSDVLQARNTGPWFDERPVLSALRGADHPPDGQAIGLVFSPGFRSVTYGDSQFRFSSKQALVVEALWEHHRNGVPKVHQTELQGVAATTQRMTQLFGDHPAYGVLIKNDGEGYYWLDT